MTRTVADRTRPDYSPSSRALPWNVLGGDLTTEHPSVEAALTATGLDYQVRTRPSGWLDDDGVFQPSGDEFFQVVRPNPNGGTMVIGQSGRRLTPVQNDKAFAVADTLVAEFGATIKGACDYRNGRTSLMVVDLGEIVLKDGQDKVAQNLLIRAPHDGSGALSFSLTPFRPSCTNAVQVALRDAVTTWKISNTPNAQGRVDLAKSAIIKAVNFRDAFQVKAEAMIDQALTDAEFAKIVAGMYPIEEGQEESRKGERRLEIRDELQTIFTQSSTLEGVRGTLWAGYNAVTEWLDWYRPATSEALRAEAQVDPNNPYARRSRAAWDRFAAMV